MKTPESGWTPAQELAAQYQSPGPAGIGFARFASSRAVTPELWDNIRYTTTEAARRPDDPAVEHWADDMVRLRNLLAAEGELDPRDAIPVLVQAARSWASELLDYIIPADEDDPEQEDTTANRRAEVDRIHAAIKMVAGDD